MTSREVRHVYLAFEFEKDASRRVAFVLQAHQYCEFLLEDLTLPSGVHNLHWQREALKRIQMCDVVIVLLGPDTHNAPGVRDELSLAGQARCPVIQLIPQSRKYGLVSPQVPVCVSKWTRINEMLNDPKAFR